MVPVRVTVAVGRRTMSVDEVRDASAKSAFKQAGKSLGTQLAKVKCPTHGSGPTDVRLHFDASNNADLKYESCCPELGKAISELLG